MEIARTRSALDGSRLGRLWLYSLASALGQYRSALLFENEFPLPYHPSRYRFRQRSFLEPMAAKKVVSFDHPGVALEIEGLRHTPARVNK